MSSPRAEAFGLCGSEECALPYKYWGGSTDATLMGWDWREVQGCA